MDVDLGFTKGLNSIVQFAMNCVKFMIQKKEAHSSQLEVAGRGSSLIRPYIWNQIRPILHLIVNIIRDYTIFLPVNSDNESEKMLTSFALTRTIYL